MSETEFIPLNTLANELSADSDSAHNTLKRSMATNGVSQRRRESVLDAASALASLGGTPSPLGVKETIRDAYAQKNEPSLAVTAQTVPLHSFSSSLRVDLSPTFPEKLMEILSNEKVSDIITWLPCGQGFLILQKRRFALEIMPHYFKQSKFTSFTRKLNRWGFTRVTAGPENGMYHHQFFRRGNYRLCMQMHCQSSTSSPKGNSPGASRKASLKRSAEMFARPSPSPTASEDINKKYTEKSQHRDTIVGFNQVLCRQRQLPRESQQATIDSDSTDSSKKTPKFDRALDQQQQLLCIANVTMRESCQSRDLQQPHPDINLAVGVQSLIRRATSSSRRQHHRLIIQSALNALKNPAQKEDVDAPTHGGSIAPTSKLHSSMQAQLRQLEDYNAILGNALKNDSRHSHLLEATRMCSDQPHHSTH